MSHRPIFYVERFRQLPRRHLNSPARWGWQPVGAWRATDCDHAIDRAVAATGEHPCFLRVSGITSRFAA